MARPLALRVAATAAPAPVMLALLVAFFATLGGCGGNFEPSIAAAPLSGNATIPSATAAATLPGTSSRDARVSARAAGSSVRRGVLLTGLPGTNAYSALRSHFDDENASMDDSTAVPAAHPTRLNAIIDRTATVGQVNAVLMAIDARIVAMQPGNSALALEVANSSESPSLRDAAARLTASRAFQSVRGPGVPLSLQATASQAADPAASEPFDDHAPPP